MGAPTFNASVKTDRDTPSKPHRDMLHPNATIQTVNAGADRDRAQIFKFAYFFVRLGQVHLFPLSQRFGANTSTFFDVLEKNSQVIESFRGPEHYFSVGPTTRTRSFVLVLSSSSPYFGTFDTGKGALLLHLRPRRTLRCYAEISDTASRLRILRPNVPSKELKLVKHVGTGQHLIVITLNRMHSFSESRFGKPLPDSAIVVSKLVVPSFDVLDSLFLFGGINSRRKPLFTSIKATAIREIKRAIEKFTLAQTVVVLCLPSDESPKQTPESQTPSDARSARSVAGAQALDFLRRGCLKAL